MGDPLPEMFVFLTGQSYVAVPLEATYLEAWMDVPDSLQDVLTVSSDCGRKQSGYSRER